MFSVKSPWSALGARGRGFDPRPGHINTLKLLVHVLSTFSLRALVRSVVSTDPLYLVAMINTTLSGHMCMCSLLSCPFV